MKKNVRDIESIADSVGVNLNSHLGFGIGKPPRPLTPIMSQQSSPEDVLDNVEKKV